MPTLEPIVAAAAPIALAPVVRVDSPLPRAAGATWEHCVDQIALAAFPISYSTITAGAGLLRAMGVPSAKQVLHEHGLKIPTGQLPDLRAWVRQQTAAPAKPTLAEMRQRQTEALTGCCEALRDLHVQTQNELDQVEALMEAAQPATGLKSLLTDPVLAPALVGVLVVLIVAALPLLALTLGALAAGAKWYTLRDDDPAPPEGEVTFEGASHKVKKPKLLRKKLTLQLEVLAKNLAQLTLAKQMATTDWDAASHAVAAATEACTKDLEDKKSQIAKLDLQVGARNKQAPMAGWGAATGTLAVLHTVDNFFGTYMGGVWRGTMSLLASPIIMVTTLLSLDQGIKGFLGTFSAEYQQLMMRLELLGGEREALEQVLEALSALEPKPQGWFERIKESLPGRTLASPTPAEV